MKTHDAKWDGGNTGHIWAAISESIAIAPGGHRATLAAVRQTLRAIDTVHGRALADQSPFPVSLIASRGQIRQGGYIHSRQSQLPVKIVISRYAARLHLTTAHEVGHYLDHCALGVNGRWASGRDRSLKQWREAVDASAATRSLREMATSRAVPVLDEATGEWTTAYLSQGYFSYVLRRREQWARSYAQYIALRSRDCSLLADLAVDGLATGAVALQWDADDFTPIATAIDRLLDDLGWRR